MAKKKNKIIKVEKPKKEIIKDAIVSEKTVAKEIIMAKKVLCFCGTEMEKVGTGRNNAVDYKCPKCKRGLTL